MRANVTFKTSILYSKDEQPIGSAVSRHLADRLRDSGVAVAEPDNYEDFAWILETSTGRPAPYLLVGYVGDGRL